MATPIASTPVRWQRLSLAETVASDRASADCYRRPEDIWVMAVVIPELKFSDIKRQILLADLVVAANDPALEDAPKALNRVGVDCADDVFASGMLDDLMWINLLDVPVAGPFVGHKQADPIGNGVHHELGENFGANRADDARHNAALAADCPDNRDFARTKAAATAVPTSAVLVVGLSTDESLVNLDHATKLVEILFDQRGANAMAHIPSRLIRAETDVAMDLPGAHALFAGEQQMDDAIPNQQIDVGIFENGPGDVGEPIAAGAAIRALPLEFHGLEFVRPVRAAARANDAIWPAAGDKIGVAGILIGEGCFELGDGHLRNLLRLLAAHNGSPSRRGENGMSKSIRQVRDHRHPEEHREAMRLEG
jgi:hypothetical protein